MLSFVCPYTRPQNKPSGCRWRWWNWKAYSRRLKIRFFSLSFWLFFFSFWKLILYYKVQGLYMFCDFLNNVDCRFIHLFMFVLKMIIESVNNKTNFPNSGLYIIPIPSTIFTFWLEEVSSKLVWGEIWGVLLHILSIYYSAYVIFSMEK